MSSQQIAPKKEQAPFPPPGLYKLFIMLPVLYFARKLDSDDADIIFWIRCSYGLVQSIIVSAVIYIYMSVTALSKSVGKQGDAFVYVPQPNPFQPDSKKFKIFKLSACLQDQCTKLATQTALGIAMNIGIHLYRGMVVGMAIQSIMAPFNLFDSKIGLAILKGVIKKDDKKWSNHMAWRKQKLFDEKYNEDLEIGDELEDSEGNTTVVDKKYLDNLLSWRTKTMEEVLLDTWDNVCDNAPLMQKVTSKNINNKTKENGWTPIMIIAAKNGEDTRDCMTKMKELGADPAIVDGEGWNALHWAAFHGNLTAATFLMNEFGVKKLTEAKDNDGKVPLDIAKEEKNDEIAGVIEGGEKKAN